MLMKDKFVRLGFHSHGNTLTVGKFERLAVQTFEMSKIEVKVWIGRVEDLTGNM